MTIGQRIDQLLVRLSMRSEASAAPLEPHFGGSKPESRPPPGSFSEDQSLADEIEGIYRRTTDALEIALTPEYARATALRNDQKDDIIANAWRGTSPREVAFRFDMPESEVRRVRRAHGQDDWGYERRFTGDD